MGGMFTVMKVREGIARDDYKDPGWYKHPAGTVAYDLKGDPGMPERQGAASTSKDGIELRAVKPRTTGGHAH
jgi:hypothetical protein